MWEVGQEVKIHSRKSQYKHIIASTNKLKWSDDATVRLCCLPDFYPSTYVTALLESDSAMPTCPRCLSAAQSLGIRALDPQGADLK